MSLWSTRKLRQHESYYNYCSVVAADTATVVAAAVGAAAAAACFSLKKYTALMSLYHLHTNTQRRAVAAAAVVS
jgi:hypothetical protein